MRNLVLLSALFAFTFSFSQEGNKKGQKREAIKQQKIAFITQEVGFTEKEAEKFWPKYNQMEEETKELRGKTKELKKSMKEIEAKSDKEIKNSLEEMLELEKEKLAQKEKFMDELFEILPAKKVAKYVRAEAKFKKVLLEKLKQQKGPGSGGQK